MANPNLQLTRRINSLHNAVGRYIRPGLKLSGMGGELARLAKQLPELGASGRWEAAKYIESLEAEVARAGVKLMGSATGSGFIATVQRTYGRVQAMLGRGGDPAEAVSKLSDKRLLAQAAKPNTSVPDLIVMEMVTRSQKQADVFQESLNHLIRNDPLRLSSVEGLIYYTNFYGEHRNEQNVLLTNLLKAGQDDIRVVPMVMELVERYPESFKSEHIPNLMRIVASKPQLEDLVVVLAQKNPDLLPHIFANCVDQHASLIVKLKQGRVDKRSGNFIYGTAVIKELEVLDVLERFRSLSELSRVLPKYERDLPSDDRVSFSAVEDPYGVARSLGIGRGSGSSGSLRAVALEILREHPDYMETFLANAYREIGHRSIQELLNRLKK